MSALKVGAMQDNNERSHLFSDGDELPLLLQNRSFLSRFIVLASTRQQLMFCTSTEMLSIWALDVLVDGMVPLFDCMLLFL